MPRYPRRGTCNNQQTQPSAGWDQSRAVGPNSVASSITLEGVLMSACYCVRCSPRQQSASVQLHSTRVLARAVVHTSMHTFHCTGNQSSTGWAATRCLTVELSLWTPDQLQMHLDQRMRGASARLGSFCWVPSHTAWLLLLPVLQSGMFCQSRFACRFNFFNLVLTSENHLGPDFLRLCSALRQQWHFRDTYLFSGAADGGGTCSKLNYSST